jgi:hypothetical protein
LYDLLYGTAASIGMFRDGQDAKSLAPAVPAHSMWILILEGGGSWVAGRGVRASRSFDPVFHAAFSSSGAGGEGERGAGER